MEIIEVQSTKKIYACPFAGCSSVFDRPYRLAQHRLVHVNVKPFVCEELNCEKAYTSKSHLDRHIKNVHKESELNILYCCPICMKKYVNRQNLKRHIKVSHIDNNKPFCCSVCRQYFKKKHQLRAHMYVHNGIKTFRCPMCERDFISLYEKKKHMRNHKTYVCEHCEKKFTRWTELMQHKRVDHVSPEYICHDCGKVFKDRGHIIRHVKKHMPNTPVTIFFCPYDKCYRHYSRNSNLNQHILVKHEGLTFDCSHCGAKLSTKAKLNEHIERHSRPDVAVKVYKTLETGRKKRKDAGTIRYETGMRLAGIVKQKIEEGISRLYNKSLHYQEDFKINSTNPSNNIVLTENDEYKILEKIDTREDENCTFTESKHTIDRKADIIKLRNIDESTRSYNKTETILSQPPKIFQYRGKINRNSLPNRVNCEGKVATGKLNHASNIIEILNRPSPSIDFRRHINTSSTTQAMNIEVKIETDPENTFESTDNDEDDSHSERNVNINGEVKVGPSTEAESQLHIKKETAPELRYTNINSNFEGNIGANMFNPFHNPSASTTALSSLLQLYWRTILNYQDV